MKTMTLASLLILTALPSAPVASEMAGNSRCPDIRLGNGEVLTSNPLPLEEKLSVQTRQCLEAMADLLLANSAVQTVTVAARAPADARRKETLELAQQAAKILIARGLPANSVSAVAPMSVAGEKPGLFVVFSVRRSARQAAVIHQGRPPIRVGKNRAKLSATDIGTPIGEGQYVETGPSGLAVLRLVDGSLVLVDENSLLFVGTIRLEEDRRRTVRIELLAGNATATVTKATDGSSFEIKTPLAVAGVRGTEFRVAIASDGTSRLETVEGLVELAGKKNAVEVAAGMGSRVTKDGSAEQPRELLPRPVITGPFFGPMDRKSPLRWKPVARAKSYEVHLARDAQFFREPQKLRANEPSRTVDAKLPTGKWFWRVVAIDSEGFVGMPSKVFAFEIAP